MSGKYSPNKFNNKNECTDLEIIPGLSDDVQINRSDLVTSDGEAEARNAGHTSLMLLNPP